MLHIALCQRVFLVPLVNLTPLELDMAVVTLGGEELQSSQWFPEVAVEVFGHCLPADLRVLKIHDFDVIFRMDWLS